MPYTITQTESLITVSFSGTLTDHDALNAARELRPIVERGPRSNELVDFTDVAAFQISPDTVRLLASNPAPFDKTSRQAVVAPTNVAYGSARMYQSKLENARPNMMVFRDRDIAMAWLEG